jgi:hypothetical protein
MKRVVLVCDEGGASSECNELCCQSKENMCVCSRGVRVQHTHTHTHTRPRRPRTSTSQPNALCGERRNLVAHAQEGSYLINGLILTKRAVHVKAHRLWGCRGAPAQGAHALARVGAEQGPGVAGDQLLRLCVRSGPVLRCITCAAVMQRCAVPCRHLRVCAVAAPLAHLCGAPLLQHLWRRLPVGGCVRVCVSVCVCSSSGSDGRPHGRSFHPTTSARPTINEP